MMMEAKPSQLRFLNRATTIFSGVVIVGLSAGLLYMARPVVTADTFHAKMDDSIEAAFAYQGSEVNIKMEQLPIIFHDNSNINGPLE